MGGCANLESRLCPDINDHLQPLARLLTCPLHPLSANAVAMRGQHLPCPLLATERRFSTLRCRLLKVLKVLLGSVGEDSVLLIGRWVLASVAHIFRESDLSANSGGAVKCNLRSC